MTPVVGAWFFFTFVIVFSTLNLSASLTLKDLLHGTGLIYLLWLFWLLATGYIIFHFLFSRGIAQEFLHEISKDDDEKNH